jgi:hypothetical protein
MNWSSPFPHEESQINMLKKKSRPKLTSYKQLEQDDDELDDYVPKQEKEKDKERERRPERIERPEKDDKRTSRPENSSFEESMQMEAPLYNKPFEFESYKPQDTVLLEKLNYMIYLLEEQRDEKTGQVTEELILYVFLGVFVLFVLDSFFKTGKYSR